MRTTKTTLSVSASILAGLSLVTQAAYASTLPAPVPRVIVSTASTWGTAADSWAGYTGQLNVWVPAAVNGGWVLKLKSPELGRQAAPASFWNTTATFDSTTQTFTLKSPSWNGNLPANSVLSVGFSASGVLDTGFALEGCTLNDQPCVATVMSADAARQTLANLQQTGAITTDPGTGTTPPPVVTPPAATPALEARFTVVTTWDGGFGGSVAVKNLSNQSLPAGATGWQVKLKFPDAATARSAFTGGPWDFRIAFATDGTVTLSPMDWAAALPAGASASSGFNGGSTASLAKAASVDPKVTVTYSASAATPPDTGNMGGGSTPVVTPPPVIVTDLGLPTGSVKGGFLFSPYKDLGISMNWNTNVMSTAATGSLRPLLDVLPVNVPAVTWAFATGECGRENWAGIAPDAIAAANVPAFVAANRNYVVSTGGAAGAFVCSTPEGMRAFINRYASRNLVGIDFDIEAGQSAEAITGLVRQLKAVEADYPQLRFSFTIATLGSSNGLAASSIYGDLNATGYDVLHALAQYPLANYTINLMVMDYGAPGPGICVVGSDGRCDMGRTAIQAAINLNAKFGVPYNHIELTPMIGVNDVRDELFSLQDTDVLVQWARSKGIAGLHFWSLDRDTPCAQAYASPICSSVSSVPTWGWASRFATDLGL